MIINYNLLNKIEKSEYRRKLRNDYIIDFKYKWILEDMNYCVKVCNNVPYIALKFGTKLYYLHRLLIFCELNKVLKSNEYVDHINHNTLDNRISNLRVGTSADNLRNRKSNINSISKYKGVSPHNNKWRAQGCIKTGRAKYIGIFDTEVQAAHAYDEKAVLWHKGKACVNFPENYTQFNLQSAIRDNK